MKRYDQNSNGYIGVALGIYPNYHGPKSAYSAGDGEAYAAMGSVESFEYSGKTYQAVFSSESGLFSGYESTDNLTEGGYTKSAIPTISYGTGTIITSQSWGLTAPSGSQVAAASLAGSSSLGNTPLGWIAGGVIATVGTILSAIQLQTQTWDFSITDAPAIVDDVAPENKKITLYRGVYYGHPDYKNALKGMAVPAGGHNDPEAHNGGNYKSIFTSWSMSKAVANYHANKKGIPGVVLTKQFNLTELVPSPDAHFELEMLVPGTVTGAQVGPPSGPGSPTAY